MASVRHQTVTNINQENVNSRLMGKSITGQNKLQPTRRPALDDLGNKMHSNQNGNIIKINSMGPPAEIIKKKVELMPKKKTSSSSSNKENVTKKENISKIPSKKPIRQESTLILRNTAQTQKKVTEQIIKKPIIEQTKELTIYDPDETSKNDPQMVTEYVEDILAYLRDIEIKFPIKEKFLEDTKVTGKMRATLVNWLVDVHMNFNLGLETLHLCVSIVDRYLQVNKAVDRTIFQLVGNAALLISCKYEELYLPDIDDFVFICDNAFTKKQILQMEIDIVKKLDFRMGWPVSIFFLRRYSKIAQVRSDQHTLAKYILELALLEYNLAHISPSIQAAAACCLSIAILNETMDPARVWTPTLVHYTTYKYSDFKEVCYEFAHMIVKAETSKFETVREKYSNNKYGKISLNCKLQGPLVRKLTISPIMNRK